MTILPSTTALSNPDTSMNNNDDQIDGVLNSNINSSNELPVDNIQKETVEEFKSSMYKMQEARRKIVNSLMNNHSIEEGWVDVLRKAYERLTNSHTTDFNREMLSSAGERFQVNVKDEIIGLRKDLAFLDKLISLKTAHRNTTFLDLVDQVNLTQILEEYHPVSASSFREEFSKCIQFLRPYIESVKTEGKKPIFITDWDGTMKDYCSQYATNLQPVYSAIDMTRFSSKFTRLAAVLTAGPGILDLTALPIDGPIHFSGSWGREWWLSGKRIVHDTGISVEGIDALERFNDEMRDLLSRKEYSQFGLVGSGVQRKVDRLTLGVQTVCNHVHPDLSYRYQEAVQERIHRVDPLKQILYFDPSTELEVEVVVHNDGTVWNKEARNFFGFTGDLPMVQHAAHRNPQGVMALFVTSKEDLTRRVIEIVGERERCCFVACPDVIHATMAQLLKEYKDVNMNEIN